MNRTSRPYDGPVYQPGRGRHPRPAQAWKVVEVQPVKEVEVHIDGAWQRATLDLWKLDEYGWEGHVEYYRRLDHVYAWLPAGQIRQTP